MSVASQIQRIKNAVADAYDSVEEKGGTLPASETVANLATAIDSITGGGVTYPVAWKKDGDTHIWVNMPSNDLTFYLYCGSLGGSVLITWGDGTSEYWAGGGSKTHTYAQSGDYEITINAPILSGFSDVSYNVFDNSRNNVRQVEFDCSISGSAGSGLVNVNSPCRYYRIGDFATAFTNVTTPNIVVLDGLENIMSASYGFLKDCKNLKSLNLASLSVVPGESFNGCNSLTDLKFSSVITSIGNYAFQYIGAYRSGFATITFSAMTAAAIMALSGFPWSAPTATVFYCSDANVEYVSGAWAVVSR